jgi:hypothetical protein
MIPGTVDIRPPEWPQHSKLNELTEWTDEWSEWTGSPIRAIAVIRFRSTRRPQNGTSLVFVVDGNFPTRRTKFGPLRRLGSALRVRRKIWVGLR